MRKKIEVKVQKCLHINSWPKQTTSQDSMSRRIVQLPGLTQNAVGTNNAEFGNGFFSLSA